jgi:glycosyltransferase involved in cell wall biosynthesis
LVSIITPSYNQGRFIEETILSVKNQDYPAVEHIIVDGGSTDNTLEILRRYEDSYDMRWISEPDRGQSDAINKGFELSCGDIMGWQNSDDTYCPGAVQKAVDGFLKHPHVDLVFGECCAIDSGSNLLQEFRLRPFDRREYLYCFSNITNQSAFWRRDLFSRSGMLDVDLKYAMDFDFFMRASEHGEFRYIKHCLGNLRIHAVSKTCSQLVHSESDWPWQAEYASIRRRYGVSMDIARPWGEQHRLWKAYFRARRLFYLVAQGQWDYLLKKATRHPLVQPWPDKAASERDRDG